MRWRSWAGIAGPAAFITTWAALGATHGDYSPVHDPISRLAALGSPTRPAMTAGFAAFAVGVAAYAPVLGSRLPGGASRAAALTAAATIGVAALPLGGAGGDTPHAVAAGTAYASLAATPLLAARTLARRGDRQMAATSTAVSIAVAAALASSAVLPHHAGLAQRLGLTIGHLWIITSAIAALRSPEREDSLRPSSPPGS